MDTITIPTFYCPIPTAISPHVETAHQDTIQWARRIGLVSSDGQQQRRLDVGKFAWLSALSQPDDSLDVIKLNADWFLWLFVNDDRVDASPLGYDMQYIAHKHHKLLEILEGAERSDADDHPLEYALYDICQRIKGMTNEYWFQRFLYSVEQYFDASIWEVKNRVENVTPDVTTFTKMRVFTSAADPSFNITLLAQNISPQHKFLRHVYVQQLTVMACNHVGWVNDVFSAVKELREGNMNNLVLVLRQAHEISFQEATNLAVEMCNDEVKAFLELEDRLPSFGDEEDVDLQKYVDVLRSWMRGHLDWYWETGRYQGEQSLVKDSALDAASYTLVAGNRALSR